VRVYAVETIPTGQRANNNGTYARVHLKRRKKRNDSDRGTICYVVNITRRAYPYNDVNVSEDYNTNGKISENTLRPTFTGRTVVGASFRDDLFEYYVPSSVPSRRRTFTQRPPTIAPTTSTGDSVTNSIPETVLDGADCVCRSVGA